MIGLKPSRARRELGNVLACAPTHAGKGLWLTYTLLTWPSSAVVLDPKGELYAAPCSWHSTRYCWGELGLCEPLMDTQFFQPIEHNAVGIGETGLPDFTCGLTGDVRGYYKANPRAWREGRRGANTDRERTGFGGEFGLHVPPVDAHLFHTVEEDAVEVAQGGFSNLAGCSGPDLGKVRGSGEPDPRAHDESGSGHCCLSHGDHPFGISLRYANYEPPALAATGYRC